MQPKLLIGLATFDDYDESSANWRSDCLFHRPAACESIAYGRRATFQALRPFCQKKCFTTASQPSIVASIPTVLGTSCPAAIFWRVVAFIVNSIKLIVASWMQLHVFEEGGKSCFRIIPALANFNATSAIVSVLISRGFVASPPHLDPAAILRRSMPAVSEKISPGNLRLLTTTRPRCPVPQRTGQYFSFGNYIDDAS